MRIGVLALDSKMEKSVHGAASAQHPNIAAAAIVDGFHQGGHEVVFPWREGIEVDQLWVSIIFAWSKPAVERLLPRWQLWTKEIIVGGSGWDAQSTLPDHLASPAPGYVERVYPDFEAGIGFTFRGCHVRCGWCIVWRKEGAVEHRVSRIADLRHSRSNHIVLMNNNWLAHREGFLEDAADLQALGLTVDANQANDITLVDDWNAPVLASLDFRNYSGRPCFRFAFDSLEKVKIDPVTGQRVRYDMMKVIPEKVRMLQEAGIAPAKLFWYMLIGYGTTLEEDLTRYELLKSLGCQEQVFAMRFRDLRGRPDVDGKGQPQGPWVKPLQRWINGHAWRACSFDEFEPWTRRKELETGYTLRRGGQIGFSL